MDKLMQDQFQAKKKREDAEQELAKLRSEIQSKNEIER